MNAEVDVGPLDDYRFSQVVEALAAYHSVLGEEMGAFRARIQHYCRLGIVPCSPGRGRRCKYSRSDVFKWAFCLELAEFGVDPVLIADIVEQHWEQIERGFRAASRDLFLHFRPCCVSGRRSEREHIQFEFMVTESPVPLPLRLARGAEARWCRHGTINISLVRNELAFALTRISKRDRQL